MLTDTGTLLSKMIGMYTRNGLNHASIAFDEELTEMYSFGRKYQSNPFIAGFVRENAGSGIFKGANCAILRCVVSTNEFEKIRGKIRHIEMNKKDYRYNFIGLLGIAVNRDIKREHAFFCSQFVATVMNEGDLQMFSVSPNLVQPCHFFDVASLTEVYEGDLQSYLYQARDEEEELAPAQMGMWRHLALRLLA